LRDKLDAAVNYPIKHYADDNYGGFAQFSSERG
jgi:hypothetical protein